MPPKINQGVPQKTVRPSGSERFKRAKSREDHAIKARLEKEKQRREVSPCADCGTGMRIEDMKSNGDPIFKHVSIEQAAKFGPHFPRRGENVTD